MRAATVRAGYIFLCNGRRPRAVALHERPIGIQMCIAASFFSLPAHEALAKTAGHGAAGLTGGNATAGSRDVIRQLDFGRSEDAPEEF
jgi:hypothetical protein